MMEKRKFTFDFWALADNYVDQILPIFDPPWVDKNGHFTYFLQLVTWPPFGISTGPPSPLLVHVVIEWPLLTIEISLFLHLRFEVWNRDGGNCFFKRPLFTIYTKILPDVIRYSIIFNTFKYNRFWSRVQAFRVKLFLLFPPRKCLGDHPYITSEIGMGGCKAI